MKVTITSGAYGWRPFGDSRVKTVRSGQSCDVPPEEADRLVSLGVAKYATAETVATPPVPPEDNAGGNDTPTDEGPGEGQETAPLDPEQLKAMTNAALTELAVDMGVEASTLKGKNKAQLIEAVLAAQVEDNEDDTVDDGETPPIVQPEGSVS